MISMRNVLLVLLMAASHNMFSMNLTVRAATPNDESTVLNIINQNDAYCVDREFVEQYLTSRISCCASFVGIKKGIVVERDDRVRAVLLYSIKNSGFCGMGNTTHIDLAVVATGTEYSTEKQKEFVTALMNKLEKKAEKHDAIILRDTDGANIATKQLLHQHGFFVDDQKNK